MMCVPTKPIKTQCSVYGPCGESSNCYCPGKTYCDSTNKCADPPAVPKGTCDVNGSCADILKCTCPTGNRCDTSTLSCVCSGSCTDPSICSCPKGTICNKNTSLCEIPSNDDKKEVYFYDKYRYSIPQLTSITGGDGTQINYDNMAANKSIADKYNATQATKEQLIAEWKGGLDSCNYGWLYNNIEKEDTNVYIPYRTSRGLNSGCEKVDVVSGDIPSASGLQGTNKWGLYLYGKKPSLPDCNGGGLTDGQECVAKYSPTKFSKYDS